MRRREFIKALGLVPLVALVPMLSARGGYATRTPVLLTKPPSRDCQPGDGAWLAPEESARFVQRLCEEPTLLQGERVIPMHGEERRR